MDTRNIVHGNCPMGGDHQIVTHPNGKSFCNKCGAGTR